jgi:hypothetical protein
MNSSKNNKLFASEELRLIKEAINIFKLDLRGLEIFTEAASGNYKWTPIMACLSNAKKVYAVTKDSKYSTADNVIKEIRGIASQLNINNRLEVIREKKTVYVKKSDIFTNSGFVRPIDADMIKNMKKTAVISLMWEPWEFREEDIDKDACRKFGIPIIGVNENHKDLRTLRYVGLTVAKLLFENNLEVFGNNILVIGSGDFLKETVLVLRKIGARVFNIDTAISNTFKIDNSAINFGAVICVENIRRDLTLIGKHGIINDKKIDKLGSNFKIIHICGKIDEKYIRGKMISLVPRKPALPGHMSFTVDYVGIKPLINLCAAGLKAGEVGARLRKSGVDVNKIARYSKIPKLLKW